MTDNIIVRHSAAVDVSVKRLDSCPKFGKKKSLKR